MLLPLTLAADPLTHVLDKDVFGQSVLSMNTITLIAVGIASIWLISKFADAIGTGDKSEGNERYITKGRFPQMFEVMVVYLRDNMIRAQLGREAGDKFAPFILTIFFFILFNNLTGLVPFLDLQHLIGGTLGAIGVPGMDSHFAIFGGTPTGRIAVTGALALVVFLLWQINGVRETGLKGWAMHFLGGAPWFLAPIMIPVEIMSMLVKPFALALRLFANMTAGHILLAVLTGFVTQAVMNIGILGAPVSAISFVASVAVMFLELLVSFIQAFIFAFLTTIFIAQMAHSHHDEHAEAQEYDADHPAVDDASVPVTA